MRLLLLILLCTSPLMLFGQRQADEIRMSIYFGGGSYFVSEDQVQSLYHWLDSVPDVLDKYDIQLISHTDPIGGKQYNEWLSEMRSNAVRELLIQRAIPEFKISVKNWGLQNPVYSNQSYQGMRMNRRVDVILYPIIF